MCFYFLHSALANEGVKSFFARRMPQFNELYRGLYTLIAIANFILILWLHSLIPSRPIFPSPDWLPALGLLTMCTGGVVVLFAIKGYGYSFFLVSKPDQTSSLRTDGMNSWLRHPLYFSVLLVLVGLVLYSPQWKNAVLFFITFIYVIIGVRLEEEKLLSQYGQAYADYKTRVKMLIPYVW